MLAIRDPIDANLEIALALGHVHIFWLEKVDVFLRLDAHELVLRRQLCLTCKRVFARRLENPLSNLLKRDVLLIIMIDRAGELASSVVTAINLSALPEHLKLCLTVKSVDLRLVLRELGAHGQLGHISLMHVAELGDEVSSLATAHNRRRILHVVTQFEQGVRGLVPLQVLRVSALAMPAMRLERTVDQWAELGLPSAEKTPQRRSLFRMCRFYRFQVFLQGLLRVYK